VWSALRPQRLDPDKRTCQTAKSLLISDGDKAMDTVEVREFEIYLARAIASGINLAAAVGMEDSVGQQFQDEVSSVYSLPISSPPPPSPPRLACRRCTSNVQYRHTNTVYVLYICSPT